VANATGSRAITASELRLTDQGGPPPPYDGAPGGDPGPGGDGVTLKGLPVLVVEDDPNNAKLVAIVLRAEGCDVHIARNAEDALTVVPIFRPRVIVLDLVLPMMSGVLLAQRLKSDTATADISIIAVTAFNGPEVERIARTAGCVAYIRKPIDAFALPRLVLDVVQGTP
jgi:CheY-like chemotaxis protein